MVHHDLPLACSFLDRAAFTAASAAVAAHTQSHKHWPHTRTHRHAVTQLQYFVIDRYAPMEDDGPSPLSVDACAPDRPPPLTDIALSNSSARV